MSYSVLQAAGGFGAEPLTQAEMDQRWRAGCATAQGEWLESSHACSYAPVTAGDRANEAAFYLSKQVQCGALGGSWANNIKACVYPFVAAVPGVAPELPPLLPSGPAEPLPPLPPPKPPGLIFGLEPLHAAALGVAAFLVVRAAAAATKPKATPNSRRRRPAIIVTPYGKKKKFRRNGMGRLEHKPIGWALAGRVRVTRVGINRGGYDAGGAYWGVGAPLWRAENDEGRIYLRAVSRDAAKRALREQYPGIRFFR